MSLKSAHNYNLKSDGVLSTYTDIPTSSVIYFCLFRYPFPIVNNVKYCASTNLFCFYFSNLLVV